MAVKIRAYLRPFSHQPGSKLLIPKSPWKAVVFPTRLEISDLTSEDKTSTIIDFTMEGPVKLFTVMQDLERSWVRVFGQSKEGFFSYRLFMEGNNLYFYVERCPDAGLFFSFNGPLQSLKRKESLLLMSSEVFSTKENNEKMHFGCFKKQDWVLVKRRLSVIEILPFWYKLGKSFPPKEIFNESDHPLLIECKKLIEERNRVDIGGALLNLFQSQFEGILCPRSKDADYQGFLSNKPNTYSPELLLELLAKSAQLIRLLFMHFEGKTLSLLQCLPKELHAGRFTNIEVTKGLLIDIEWSKKMLKRVIFYPKKDHTIELRLQKGFRSFRLSCGSKKQGIEMMAGQPLLLQKGTRYLLDRLKK